MRLFGLGAADIRSFVSERRALLVTSLSSLALRIAGLLSSFALGVVLARTLGPANFGIYGLVTTVAGLMMIVSLFGTPQLAVRELSVRSARGDWGGVKAVIAQFAAATTTVSIALGLIALFIAILATNPGSPTRLYVLQGVMLALLMTWGGLMGAELRGLGALFKGQVLDVLARPALAFGGIVALIVLNFQITTPNALWTQILVALLAVVLSFAWVRTALPAHARTVPRAPKLKWLGMALPLGGVDVLRQLDGSYGIILMGWLASDAELGVFRVAVACSVLGGMPVTMLHIILAPTISRLYDFDRKPELQTLLSATSLALVLALAPITLASWLIGRPAIELVFGSAYGDAWLPLFLLCTSQLCYALFGMGPILLAMCRGERQLIKIYAIAEVVGIIAAIPLIRAYGAPGAAAAPILTMAIIGSLSRRYARNVMGVDITFLPLVRRALRHS